MRIKYPIRIKHIIQTLYRNRKHYLKHLYYSSSELQTVLAELKSGKNRLIVWLSKLDFQQTNSIKERVFYQLPSLICSLLVNVSLQANLFVTRALRPKTTKYDLTLIPRTFLEVDTNFINIILTKLEFRRNEPQ